MPRFPSRALLLALSLSAVTALGMRAQTPDPVPNPAPTPQEKEAAQVLNPAPTSPDVVPHVPNPAPTPPEKEAAHKEPTIAPLSLEECIARAMQSNFDLQTQGFSTEIAKENLNIAKAGLEPNFSASIRRNLNQSASSTTTLDGTTAAGPRTDSTTTAVGVTSLVSSGATLSANSNVTRFATNSSNATLNPSFGSTIAVTASQPLLKGFGRDVNLANIRINRLGVDIANLSFKSRVLQVIHDTETAYYNLAFAREQLIVKQHSLTLAQSLFDENTTRKNTGVATDLDVVSAEVGVANARLGIVQAEQAVRNSEDALLNLIGPVDFNNRPGPVHFSEFPDHAPGFDLSYKLTRDNDPDYASAQAAIKQAEISVDAAKQNRLPTLNVDGTVGYNATNSSYTTVVNDLPQGKGYNWGFGVTLGLPWGLHADRARYRSALASLRQEQARLAQLDQNLVVDVRADVRAVEANIASVQIAAKSTELSQRQYDLQKARLDAGLSTSFLVLQAQDALETAKVNELQARVNLGVALANLHQLEGSSITQYKVQLPE